MPAPNPERMLHSAAVKALIQAIARTFFPNCGNDCIVWQGSFVDVDRRHPVATGKMGGKSFHAQPRQFLCPDDDARKQVLMTCKTPGCVNPKHMTRVDSARPKDIGQGMHTAAHGNSFSCKIGKEAYSSVHACLDQGFSQAAIAASLGVSQSTISRIARKR